MGYRSLSYHSDISHAKAAHDATWGGSQYGRPCETFERMANPPWKWLVAFCWIFVCALLIAARLHH